jgi:uncharacterized protein YecT (DUF1311 family)
MYIGAMIRLVPLILLALGTVALCQDDETKCCCTTYDMSVCLGRIHKQTDAELNKTYQQALRTVTAGYAPQDI